jgi:hypothetical protein
VRALGPPPAGCGAIVTSRSPLSTLDGAAQLMVGVLGPDEALDLLRAHLGAERVDAEPVGASLLARRCEHLPLAIRVAAARLAARQNWSIRSFAERLAAPASRLDVLVCETLSLRDCVAAAARVLAGSHGSQPLRELRLLAELDVAVVTVPTLAMLLGAPESVAEATAEHLVDAGLAEALPAGRYRVPEFVRAFAMETSQPGEPASAELPAVPGAVAGSAVLRRAPDPPGAAA